MVPVSEDSTVDCRLGRRAFLARVGLLGAVLATGALSGPAAAAVRAGLRRGAGVASLLPELREVLAEVARDTMNGLAVFVVPGPDPYSAAQGTPRTAPGAIEAKTPEFLMAALDNFVPLPDQVADPLTGALAIALEAQPIPLPDELISLPLGEVDTLHEAVRGLLDNDETIPASVPIALLLNLVATRVNPAAVSGAFVSPFARLTYAEKAEAFALMEGADPELVGQLDSNLPEPLSESLSGLLRFVSGALLEFGGFGTFCEWAVFDPATKQLEHRPVGWQLTGYQPDGPVEGWDDLLGYYPGTEG